MKIHWLQHVEFEGLGMISGWANQRDHKLHSTRFWNGETLPLDEDFDMLIIMGGPMSIHDESMHPWLIDEKRFIKRCIERKIPILGICLGAQLLADCLGAEVRPHRAKEIGWFPVEKCRGVGEELDKILPASLSVLHWHGDTFTLPPGSQHFYESIACSNQAYVSDGRFVGLQFHLEISDVELPQLIHNCRDELKEGEWIQTENELLSGTKYSEECGKVLFQLLDYISSKKNE